MTDHQVLPTEPATRRQPTASDVAALRRLLSGALFEPESLDCPDDDPETVEEDGCADSAPHCRHAMHYVD